MLLAIVATNEHKRNQPDFDGLVRDCSNYSALAMELLQSCT